MPTKVKVQGFIFKKDLIPNISNRFARELKDEIVDLVTDEIKSGLSPVARNPNPKGKGRFRQYTEQYAKWKRTSRKSVDMTLSGKMLRSLRATQNSRGQVRVFFANDEPARYHDRDGAGKSKVIRRLLPTRKGETFKQSILSRIVSILQKAFDRETS